MDDVNRPMTRDRRTEALWWLLPFVALILFAIVQVSRGVYFYMFTHDMFIPLEGVLHLQNGHLPHRDFGSPIGALYFVIHYVTSLVAPVSAKTLIYANLLVAVVVALVTLIVGRRRLPLWLASLTGLYLGIVASSPRQIGEPFAVITNNASYNRFGWALIGLLAIIAACPRVEMMRRSFLIDGVAVGALLTALFLIKVTYFLAAVGIILLALVTVRRRLDWQFPLAVFGTCASILLTIELTTGLIALYLADINMAASVATNVLRPLFAVRLLFYCATGAVAVLIVGLINEWDGQRSPLPGPRTLLSLGIVLSGVAIGIQNHPELENPLMAIAILIAGYPSLQFIRSSKAATQASRHDAPAGDVAGHISKQLAGRACAVGFLAMAAVSTIQDVAAISWTAMAPRASSGEMAWLAHTPISDLTMFDAGPSHSVKTAAGKNVGGDVAVIGVIGDGVALLRPHLRGRKDAVVLPLTFSNPFPLILGLAPVRHELAWWHADRTFSRHIKPDASLLFEEVDYIMVPKRYMTYSTVEAFRSAYDPQIKQGFQVVDENRSWQLLARSDCQVRNLC